MARFARHERAQHADSQIDKINLRIVSDQGHHIIRNPLLHMGVAKGTKKGQILPRRMTGNCAKHQRQLSEAVKRARAIALMPYTVD